MSHLDEGQLQAFLDDQLSGRDRAAAAEHLMACAACRAIHEELRRSQAVFSSTIPLLDGVEPVAVPRVSRRRAFRLPVAFARAAALVLFLAATAAAAVPGSPVREWVAQMLDREPQSAPRPATEATAAVPDGTASSSPVALEGWVRDLEDRPLAFAQVSVMEDTIMAWTDESGAYRLDGRPAAEWRVQVDHPGHQREERTVRLPEQGAVSVDFSLRPAPGPARDPLADFEPIHVSYTLPALLNVADITAAIERAYPTELIERGAGGEAVLLIWVDERGRVARSIVSVSSGQRELDRIALAVSRQMRFRPARRGEEAVRVIVQIPVIFAPGQATDER